MELQTGTPLFNAGFKLLAEDNNFLLQTFHSVVTLFQDHSFYKKVKKNLANGVAGRNLLCLMRDSNFLQKTLLFSSRHFILSSLYSQTTPSMRKLNFFTNETSFVWCGIQPFFKRP